MGGLTVALLPLYVEREKRWQGVVTSLLGPLSNALLSALLFAIYFIANFQTEWLRFEIHWLAVTQLVLALFNLLPAVDFDGGKILLGVKNKFPLFPFTFLFSIRFLLFLFPFLSFYFFLSFTVLINKIKKVNKMCCQEKRAELVSFGIGSFVLVGVIVLCAIFYSLLTAAFLAFSLFQTLLLFYNSLRENCANRQQQGGGRVGGGFNYRPLQNF